MRALLCALVALAAGCAALPSSVEGILGETVQAARAPAAEQAAALARAQQALRGDPGPRERLRLAALLATLPPPLRDEARALELLAPLVEAGSPAVRSFAAFLTAQIAERQRLARELERLAKERAALEREHQMADKERDKREEALRQQIEALRAIERGILEREERLRQKPGARR